MRYLIILLLLWTTLNAQNREALLIGNSNYKYISNLNDTSKNLSRLKITLESLGFSVKVKTNLEAKKLKEAIDNFKEQLAKSHDTIGFLYYTGHGCQMDNVGYLIPTNVNSSKRLDVQYDAINIDKMLETLREAGNRVNMVFLDACRDNTPTGKKGGKKGLAQAPVMPKGTLVVYATEATKTADDNSNFINSLISQIKQPNRSIRDIGYNISDDVASQTKEQQVPQVFAQRVPNVVLRSGGGGDNHPMKGITIMNGIMYQNQPFSSQDKFMYENHKHGGRVGDWQGATKYCEGLTLGNFYDWRLPNINELREMANIELYHINYEKNFKDIEYEIAKKNKYMNKVKHKININSKGYKYYVKKIFVENMPPLSGVYKISPFWSSSQKSSGDIGIVRFHRGNDDWAKGFANIYTLCVRESKRGGS